MDRASETRAPVPYSILSKAGMEKRDVPIRTSYRRLASHAAKMSAIWDFVKIYGVKFRCGCLGNRGI